MIKMKTCCKCKNSKPISQFSNENGETKWCLGCRNQQKRYNYTHENKTMRDDIRYLLDKKIITKDERSAAVDLLESCDSRISACKYSKLGDKYYGIFCFWDSRLQMFIDIVMEKPDMWQKWKYTFSYWIVQGCPDNLSPQIVRILEGTGNNHIGYRLDNIQCLTKEENARKANIREYYLFDGLEITKVVGWKQLEDQYDLPKSKISKALKDTQHFNLSRIDGIKIANKESAQILLPIYEYFKVHELLNMKKHWMSQLEVLKIRDKTFNHRREKLGLPLRVENDEKIELMIKKLIQQIDHILSKKGVPVHGRKNSEAQ